MWRAHERVNSFRRRASRLRVRSYTGAPSGLQQHAHVLADAARLDDRQLQRSAICRCPGRRTTAARARRAAPARRTAAVRRPGPRDRNAPASVAPASTWTSLTPRSASSAQHRLEVEAAVAHRHRRAIAPRCRAAAWRRARGCTASAHRLRARGRARRSPGPDRAPRAAAATNGVSSSSRTVSCGSSASTVPAPVSDRAGARAPALHVAGARLRR